MIRPQTQREEQLVREHELRKTAERVRREDIADTTGAGRFVAGALRALSTALARTADALDAPCDRVDRETSVIDRA